MRKELLELPTPKSAVTRRYRQYELGKRRMLRSSLAFAVAATGRSWTNRIMTVASRPGMTARLTVSYRAPTPLDTDLRLEGELERVEGRKIFTVGRCFDGDVLTAEAEGLFISIRPERFASLQAAREAARRGAR